jgi:uncharacterized Zn finger protein
MRGPFSFTERDILRNCGRGNFDDGERDLGQGRVLDVEIDRDEHVEGDVEGRSGRTVFGASIVVGTDDDGAHIGGNCTCHERDDCRHVVAVLLGALRKGTVSRPPPPTPVERAACSASRRRRRPTP